MNLNISFQLHKELTKMAFSYVCCRYFAKLTSHKHIFRAFFNEYKFYDLQNIQSKKHISRHLTKGQRMEWYTLLKRTL